MCVFNLLTLGGALQRAHRSRAHVPAGSLPGAQGRDRHVPGDRGDPGERGAQQDADPLAARLLPERVQPLRVCEGSGQADRVSQAVDGGGHAEGLLAARHGEVKTEEEKNGDVVIEQMNEEHLGMEEDYEE
jgi:hypothetical protein